MRGNLRQIMAIPEEGRTEAQRKAILKITGALNHARHEQMEKGRKMAARIRQLEGEALLFENHALALMVLRAIACVASDEGYAHGTALRDMADGNPFMSSAALDQLESMEYLKRLPDGAVMLTNTGLKNNSRRRSRI